MTKKPRVLQKRNGKAINSTQRPEKGFNLKTFLLISITAFFTWLFSSYLHGSISFNPKHHPLDFLPTQLIQSSDSGKFSMPQPFDTKAHENSGIQIQKGGLIDYSDYTGPSKVFTKFEHPFPCFEGEKQLMRMTPAHEGILFHRPMKTGSTTLTGIVLRLVHNRGQQQYGFDKCKHRSIHGTGLKFEFGKRDKTKSFLFSIIREPQARALSQVFHFQISVGQNEPTDKYLKEQLLTNVNYMHYFVDLGTRNYTLDVQGDKEKLAQMIGYKSAREHKVAIDKSAPEEKRKYERSMKHFRKFGGARSVHDLIGDILDDYDLILIMERMDESLVAFQMLLNLTTKEILYTRARSGGSWSNGFPERPCLYIRPSFKSPGLTKYLASDDWQNHIAPDVQFYKAAHKSLDRTIEYLGREAFSENLSTFRAALKLAAKNCEGRIRSMCSSGGAKIFPVNTTCYFWAEGCDHDCIDELDL
eukprot:CAMPEP_0178900628 /NCGR_PEP_ID=MMETSP0786-20121207/3573_1 /TAXON_ID=186022 /ORGANISM="Thalassionema frauenfeldii, Strain CCMP 1798" /LENGTH=471 /DNA_ID=CAMNT_0020571641 /DNA_START=4 /DNA_END=1419 /DNA_ORIENTATION=+